MSRFCFEHWEFDSDTGVLTCNVASDVAADGQSMHLRHQTALLLTLLLENAPELVSRSAMQSALWPENVIVDFDTGINSCIKQLRQALNDPANKPQFVRTIPRRGFQFIPPVTRVNPVDTKKRARRIWLAWGLALLLSAMALFWMLWQPETKSAPPTVAILPFDNLSGDPDSERIRTRLLDGLILAVAEHQPKNVSVLSRTQVIELGAGTDRQSLFDSFDVHYVVDGSIRKIPNGWIVTASFSETRNGRHLWGQLVEVSDQDPSALGTAIAELGQAVHSEFIEPATLPAR